MFIYGTFVSVHFKQDKPNFLRFLPGDSQRSPNMYILEHTTQCDAPTQL